MIDAQLVRREAELGLATGTVGLFALLETARGIQRAGEIALAAPGRLRQLVFGLGDFSAEIGVEPSEHGLSCSTPDPRSWWRPGRPGFRRLWTART